MNKLSILDLLPPLASRYFVLTKKLPYTVWNGEWSERMIHAISAGLVRGLKDCSPGVRQKYTTRPGIGQKLVIDRL